MQPVTAPVAKYGSCAVNASVASRTTADKCQQICFDTDQAATGFLDNPANTDWSPLKCNLDVYTQPGSETGIQFNQTTITTSQFLKPKPSADSS